MRLIDADALKDMLIEVLESIRQNPKMTRDEIHIISGCHMLCEMIDDAPTADAVEVVRCRDCKYWSGRNDKPGEVTAIGYCDHPNHHIMPLRAGCYCADGAKMDGGAEE